MRCWLISSMCCVTLAAGTAYGQTPSSPGVVTQARASLSVADAIGWALQHNPEIAALRQQHGIAAAGVVIARTYPYNPTWQAVMLSANGPQSAGITNRVFNQHLVMMQVEVRGQGRLRGQVASAALSRTDWEIASQEVGLSVRVARAFNSVLYRQEKLRLMDETVRRQEHTVEEVRKLLDQGKLRAADLIAVRSDLLDLRLQRENYRTVLVAAWHDLRRLLGIVGGDYSIGGLLDVPIQINDPTRLVQSALDVRPDLHAQQMAVAEADARVRLERANRFGNPAMGPDYELNETLASLIGAEIVMPLPVFNGRRGEILQRQAEYEKTILDLRRVEVQVQQDVLAAVDRLKEAQRLVSTYRDQALPELRGSLKSLEKMFSAGEPGVDYLRLVEGRRRILKTEDGLLDALWQASEARADLAAASGDIAVVNLSAVPAGSP
jgi:outer membrane protein TolC